MKQKIYHYSPSLFAMKRQKKHNIKAHLNHKLLRATIQKLIQEIKCKFKIKKMSKLLILNLKNNFKKMIINQIRLP